MSLPSNVAELEVGGTRFRLPLLSGTLGPGAIDIRRLQEQTGLLAYDPGLQNTATCESQISYVDGEKGRLLFRGIPIEHLASNHGFLEVSHLLIRGFLPSPQTVLRWESSIDEHSLTTEQWQVFARSLPERAPPMAVLTAGIALLSAHFPQYYVDDQDESTFDKMMFRLLSSMRSIAAVSFRRSRGEPLFFPEPSGDYLGQFLRMLFSWQGIPFHLDPRARRTLEVLLVIHADHEQNCSTSAVRLVGSSRVNLYASICAGVCALWGPLHGGAGPRVIDLLEDIAEGRTSIARVLDKAKGADVRDRLPGFGHRVYKTHDPRAVLLKNLCLSREMAGSAMPLWHVARDLEAAARDDSYFVERNLFPNIDFYSGVLYRSLGIPKEMIGVLFAMARLPGWIAQWKEMHEAVPFRIGRPRQVYQGESEYIPA